MVGSWSAPFGPKVAPSVLHYFIARTNSLQQLSQCSLSVATSCHGIEKRFDAKRRSSSSHLNHLVRTGLLMRRLAGMSRTSHACHCESLHVVVRRAKRSSFIRSTCPAQLHLLRRCVSTQNLTLALRASCRAARVDLRIQSTHCSSGLRPGPAIRLNILCCVLCSRRFSVLVNSQDSQHHEEGGSGA